MGAAQSAARRGARPAAGAAPGLDRLAADGRFRCERRAAGAADRGRHRDPRADADDPEDRRRHHHRGGAARLGAPCRRSDRPVPLAARARHRRHGRRLARRAQRRPDAAARCAEAAVAHRVPQRSGGAPGARTRHPRDARTPAHRPALRRRSHLRRPALPGPRIRRRRAHRRTLRTPRRRPGGAAAPVPAGGAGGCTCPCQAGRAPRPEAVEHPRHARRPGAPARLRHRSAARRRARRSDRADAARRPCADAGLCVAGADRRRPGDDRQRRLFARRAAL